MAQAPVIALDDITQMDFSPHRLPGCERALVYQDSTAQTAAFRVSPGSGVPRHLHTRVTDYFVCIAGQLEIRYEGQQGSGIFQLKPGAYLALPPGVRHEVYNPSGTDEAYFLLVHTPHEGFDVRPAEFRELTPKLPPEEFKR